MAALQPSPNERIEHRRRARRQRLYTAAAIQSVRSALMNSRLSEKGSTGSSGWAFEFWAAYRTVQLEMFDLLGLAHTTYSAANEAKRKDGLRDGRAEKDDVDDADGDDVEANTSICRPLAYYSLIHTGFAYLKRHQTASRLTISNGIRVGIVITFTALPLLYLTNSMEMLLSFNHVFGRVPELNTFSMGAISPAGQWFIVIGTAGTITRQRLRAHRVDAECEQCP